jgi:ribosomal-protein-alanine N-acetyltransferase
LGLADLERIYEVFTSDPVATKYMAFPRATSPEDGRAFLEHVESSFAGRSNGSLEFAWLIQIKERGEFIGNCGMGTHIGATVGGGYILNPAFWGKGYAAEAWNAVFEWAKTQPDIQRIEARHHPDNPASGVVMRKVGLTFDSIKRRENGYPNLGDGIVDELVYAWERA